MHFLVTPDSGICQKGGNNDLHTLSTSVFLLLPHTKTAQEDKVVISAGEWKKLQHWANFSCYLKDGGQKKITQLVSGKEAIQI